MLAVIPLVWGFIIRMASTNIFHHLKYLSSQISILWQYGLWSFQTGDTELVRFLSKNQHTQRKLLNFEFWINDKLSKKCQNLTFKVNF